MPESKGRKVKGARRPQHMHQSSHPAPAHPQAKRLLYRTANWLGPTLRRTPSRVWSLLTFERLFRWGAFAVTFSAAALFFLPRVSVEPSGPYNPSSPSPVTFTITNANIVPLRNVRIFVGLCYVDPPDGQRGVRLRSGGSGNSDVPTECNGPAGVKLTPPIWRNVRWLDADERIQIAIEEAIRRDSGSPPRSDHA